MVDLYSFRTITGEVIIDDQKCIGCKDKPCIAACQPRLLKLENEKPVLAIDREAAAKGKCIECLACELDCGYLGSGGLTINLPLPQLTS
ncbi:MAG: 4Fe-4S dicluster domain-containing protein [Bacillota bacterium]